MLISTEFNRGTNLNIILGLLALKDPDLIVGQFEIISETLLFLDTSCKSPLQLFPSFKSSKKVHSSSSCLPQLAFSSLLPTLQNQVEDEDNDDCQNNHLAMMMIIIMMIVVMMIMIV